MVTALLKRFWRWYLRRKGLDLPADCRFMGFPRFGSEPYLINIGRRVTLASHVSFITHDGGTSVFRDLPRYQRVIKYGRIVVHDNCFIGNRSIIMPGVSIGPNAVIAAGSIVTKSVPPNRVAAGVPARVICTVEEYAEKALRNTPDYDVDKYFENKQRELLKVLPIPTSTPHGSRERDENHCVPISRSL